MLRWCDMVVSRWTLAKATLVGRDVEICGHDADGSVAWCRTVSVLGVTFDGALVCRHEWGLIVYAEGCGVSIGGGLLV